MLAGQIGGGRSGGPGGLALGTGGARGCGQDEQDQREGRRKKKDGRRGSPSPAVDMGSAGSVTADPGVARLDYPPIPRSYQGVLSSTNW